MKISKILLLMCMSMNSHAQLIKSSGKIWNSKEILNRINDTTAYFIDYEKKSGKADLATINPNEIASITAYFEDEQDLPIVFKDYFEHGVISFITKKYAIRQYRPALSKLSNEYLELTRSHRPDADSLFYILDGESLIPTVEGKLMNLDFAKIKSIKILLPDEAEKLYGDKARLGAVIISSTSE